jgi:hypothetical protein
MRLEVREFIQAADTLFSHDSSLTEGEREVLGTYAQALVEKYLTWFEHPPDDHDS